MIRTITMYQEKQSKNVQLLKTLYSTNLSSLIVIASNGKIYQLSLTDLTLHKDHSIHQLCNIESDQKILTVMDMISFNSYHSLITVSKNGYVKRTLINEYNLVRKKGVIAVKLEENDLLASVLFSFDDNDKLLIVSNNHYYNYYPVNTVNCTGRATKGIKGIKLNKDEYVSSAKILQDDGDFSITSRAVKGNKILTNTW